MRKKVKLHKNTSTFEVLYSKKDFNRLGLKRNFKFNTNLKIANKSLAVTGDKHLYIKGYASTADQDRVDDIITLPALEKSKDDLLQPGSRTVFYNHNKGLPIGRVMSTKMDDKGLICEIQISNAKDCEDIRTKIKEKVLNSLSIGGRYKKVQVERDDNGEVTAFKVMDIELLEVSVVGLPCNAKASIFNAIEKSFKGLSIKEKKMKTKKSKKEIKKNKKTKITKAQPAEAGLSNEAGRPAPKVGGPTIPATPAGMPAEHAKHISEVAAAINDHVVKNYFQPMQKSLDTIAEATSMMHQHMANNYPQYMNDARASKSKGKSKTEKEKKLPKWARIIQKSMKSIKQSIKDFDKIPHRKGGVATKTENLDEDENGSTEENVDTTPKKVLKDAEDADTVKYVKYLMENPDTFEKLDKSEKEKASSIYFVLMDHSNRQDRRR